MSVNRNILSNNGRSGWSQNPCFLIEDSDF